jgi:hypothetical protein
MARPLLLPSRLLLFPEGRGTALALLLALAVLSGPAHASELTGPEGCRVCHVEAYRVWSTSRHARAAELLSGAQRQQPLCLQCHSRDETRAGAAAVVGVSCETCHGAGRSYANPVVMRDRDLARLFGLVDLAGPAAGPLCLSCHGGELAQLYRPFDLPAALARIDHWSVDRAARKSAQAAAAAGSTQ